MASSKGEDGSVSQLLMTQELIQMIKARPKAARSCFDSTSLEHSPAIKNLPKELGFWETFLNGHAHCLS